jgi:hypothetical protein
MAENITQSSKPKASKEALQKKFPKILKYLFMDGGLQLRDVKHETDERGMFFRISDFQLCEHFKEFKDYKPDDFANIFSQLSEELSTYRLKVKDNVQVVYYVPDGAASSDMETDQQRSCTHDKVEEFTEAAASSSADHIDADLPVAADIQQDSHLESDIGMDTAMTDQQVADEWEPGPVDKRRNKKVFNG